MWHRRLEAQREHGVGIGGCAHGQRVGDKAVDQAPAVNVHRLEHEWQCDAGAQGLTRLPLAAPRARRWQRRCWSRAVRAAGLDPHVAKGLRRRCISEAVVAQGEVSVETAQARPQHLGDGAPASLARDLGRPQRGGDAHSLFGVVARRRSARRTWRRRCSPPRDRACRPSRTSTSTMPSAAMLRTPPLPSTMAKRCCGMDRVDGMLCMVKLAAVDGARPRNEALHSVNRKARPKTDTTAASAMRQRGCPPQPPT